VRALLSSTVVPNCSRDGAATVEDVWRAVAQHSQRQLQTEVLRNALASDPFERWFRDVGCNERSEKEDDDDDINEKIQQLQERVQVVDYNCVHTRQGYVSIEATARLPVVVATTDDNNVVEKSAKKQRRSPTATSTSSHLVKKHVQLQFRYERTCGDCCDDNGSPPGSAGAGAQVWYSIDVSKDYGPAEPLLWVQVWANGAVPAPGRAKNMEADVDDDDQWSDMDDNADDEDNRIEEEENKTAVIKSSNDEDDSKDNNNIHVEKEPENGSVAIRSTFAASTTKTQQPQDQRDASVEDEDEQQPHDRFVAGIDPDLLQQFLNWSQLAPMDYLTAFFLLMTFPFYEHEWDLVGLLLDAVFGVDGEESEGGAGEEEESGPN